MAILFYFYSHIQRIVLATKKTTVTQQARHGPIECQSRLWPQRGTKVNGSHSGDNSLLRPAGIHIATKCSATLQAMAPNNVETVHQTPITPYREQPRSTRNFKRKILTHLDLLSIRQSGGKCQNVCRLPTTSVLSNKADKLRSNH